MNFILLLVLLLPTASRDGEYLRVDVPETWEHVTVEVDPPCEFVEVNPGVFLGVTEVNSGVVSHAVCEEGKACELFFEDFSVPGVSWFTVVGFVVFVSLFWYNIRSLMRLW